MHADLRMDTRVTGRVQSNIFSDSKRSSSPKDASHKVEKKQESKQKETKTKAKANKEKDKKKVGTPP
jgi:hypothetical protein